MLPPACAARPPASSPPPTLRPSIRPHAPSDRWPNDCTAYFFPKPAGTLGYCITRSPKRQKMTAKCSPPPLLVLVAAACLATLVAGHSSLVSPISRNAVDRNLRPWQGGRFGNNQSCAHPSRESENDADIRARFGLCWGCNCVNSTGTCDVAQTCLWVSVAARRSVFFFLLFMPSPFVCVFSSLKGARLAAIAATGARAIRTPRTGAARE